MNKGSERKSRPTQHDVARLAGVSRAAVSHVLNNNTAIAIPVETRQRIFEAMETLGYVPDRSAQSLRTRKTYTIASIIPDITNPFYPAFQRGIQDVARRHGYDLILYNTDNDDQQELKCLRSVQQGRVDGVIAVLFGQTGDELRRLVESGVSVLCITGPHPTDLPIDSVYVDNAAAARTAVTYLIERGHRRIGMISGLEAAPPQQWRIQGYREALISHGITPDDHLICNGDFTDQGGYLGMQALLQFDPRPTAVFAANDLMAIGALRAIREYGLRVPDDIAIVGFDNIPIADLVIPRLTTIAQFQERMGQRAAELLFERIEGKAPPVARFEELPFELIIRESA